MGLEPIYFLTRLVSFVMFYFPRESSADHADWNVSLNLQVIPTLILPNHNFPACMNGIFAQGLIATYG